MAEDKAAALAQFRLRTKQLEEEHEQMKDEFANKQKAMLEEAKRNAANIQEACDADRAAWKRKFDQLSGEIMNTRSEMFENSKKHSEEMIELRRKAREREEELDEEARKMREEKVNLETQLLNAKSAIAELEMEVKRGEAMKKELEDERKKCEELKGKCESYATKEAKLEARVEQLKKDAESQKERLENEIQKLEDANKSEVGVVREALESLKKDYSELELKRKNEIEKMIEEEKQREAEIEEMKTADEEKRKRVEELESLLKEAAEEKKRRVEELEASQNETLAEKDNRVVQLEKSLKDSLEENGKRVEQLEALLKDALEEKERTSTELKHSRIQWENEQQQLEKRIEELEDASEDIKEAEIAFDKMRSHLEELQAEKECLEQKAEEEAFINRRLGTEVHSLEAQLAHADQQIREQRQEIEDRSNVESQRRKTIGGVRPPMYHPQALNEEDSSTDSEDGLPFKLEDLSSSLAGSRKAIAGSNNPLNKSLASLHSVSSSSLRPGVQTRASRRQSAIYVRGSTPPERRTTNSAAYFILGDEFHPEMEQDSGVEYNWTRLAELQRRNASCLPHLQTSYPVETQMGPDFSGQEDALKTGRMSLDASLVKPYNTRKRKSEEIDSIARISGRSGLPKSKSAPNITPAKQSRSQRFNQAMQSALGSLRSRSNENLSKDGQDTEASSRRESVAYNIEISPPKKTKTAISRRRTISRYTGTSRLLGEKSKDSLKKSKTQHLGLGANHERKPLRTRQEKSNGK